MHIRKITALLTLLLLIVSSVSVYAAEPVKTAYATVEASQNGTNWEATVTGSSVQMPGTVVLLNMLYPGVSIDSLGGAQPLKNQSAYTDSTSVGSDGSFSFTIPFKEDDLGGVYTVYVFIPGEAKPIEIKVPCMNYTRRADTLVDAQTADATTLKETLVQGIGDLNAVASQSYADYDDERREYVASYIVNTKDVWNAPAEDESKFAILETQIGDVVDALDTIMDLSKGDREFITNTLAFELSDVANSGDGILMLDPEVLASYGALAGNQKEKAVVQMELQKGSLVYPEDVSKALKASVEEALKTPADPTPSNPGNAPGVVDRVETDDKFITDNNKTELPDANDEFADLASVPWAKDAINILASRGILSGKGNGLFCPTDTITRAEFSQMIVKAFDLRLLVEKTMTFTDVIYGDWYYEAVQILCHRNIIKGLSATEFGASKPISRQDMAVIVSRALNTRSMAIERGESITFTDADQIASYAQGAVDDLTRAGIIAGNSDGSFAPRATATRAEAAVIIYRIMYALNLL